MAGVEQGGNRVFGGGGHPASAVRVDCQDTACDISRQARQSPQVNPDNQGGALGERSLARPGKFSPCLSPCRAVIRSKMAAR